MWRGATDHVRQIECPEKSLGAAMATAMRAAASDVTEGVIPDSGHWIMAEKPAATVAMIRAFLDKGR
jgi:pimeloyl-ACP methyl ester carboxylesterase